MRRHSPPSPSQFSLHLSHFHNPITLSPNPPSYRGGIKTNIWAATFQLVSEQGYISCCKDCKRNSAAADSVLPALEVSWRTCENRSKTRGTITIFCLQVLHFVPAVYFRFSPELFHFFPSALTDAKGTKLDFRNDRQYVKSVIISYQHVLQDGSFGSSEFWYLFLLNYDGFCIFYFFCYRLFKKNLGQKSKDEAAAQKFFMLA